METPAQKAAREQRELDEGVTAALRRGSDAEVRAALEALATKYRWSFAATLPRWGAQVYQRDRVLFRSIVLAALDVGAWAKGWERAPVEAWLAEADRADDVEVFRRVYGLHVRHFGPKDPAAAWRAELLRRYRAAPTPEARAVVLEKLQPQWGWTLDEPTAVALYQVDPLSRDFLLTQAVGGWRGEGWWGELQRIAGQRGDETFRLALWRRQVDKKPWRAEVLAVCDRVRAPDALLGALEARHLEKYVDVGDVFAEMLEKRGEDVLPYVTPRVSARPRWFGAPIGYDALRGLAVRHGWWPLWAAVMARVATASQWNAEIVRLSGPSVPESEARRLLSLLAEARHALEDAAAVALFRRFPDLLGGAFRDRFAAYGPTYASLLDEAVARGDDDVVDLLASKFVLSMWGQMTVVDRLADLYEALPGTPAFARRAGAVLGSLPAFGVWNYGELVRKNRLARFLFERTPAEWLADGAAVRDLLESPQIHVQVLAFRVLAQDDDRARRLAAENADLLVPTLLRALHGRTRRIAFAALANAAADPDVAARVLAKAREALDLPDVRYPKEKLVGLIGAILHRHPALRGAKEQPTVFVGRASA